MALLGFSIRLLVVLGLLALSTACPSHNETAMYMANEKRWYSIRVPAVRDAHLVRWPRGPDGYHTIHYCYETAGVYLTMHTHVLGALQIWLPAIAASSLRIKMYGDPNNPRTSLCATAPGSVLRIDRWNEPRCAATEGFRSAGTGMSLKCGPDPAANFASVAHEFGHVFGLRHEHQRPDANSWLQIRCENIVGYAAALGIIRYQNPSPPYQQGDTIDKVCTDHAVGARYGMQFVDIMPDPNWDRNTVDGPVFSRSFDYKSIMLYDSFTYAQPDAEPDKNRAVMLGRSVTNPYITWELFPGGKFRRPGRRYISIDETKISEGDIARIAQMYPNPPVTPPEARKPEWQEVVQRTIRVVPRVPWW